MPRNGHQHSEPARSGDAHADDNPAPAGFLTLTERVLKTERSTLALAHVARAEVTEHHGSRVIAEGGPGRWQKYAISAAPLVLAVAIAAFTGSGGASRITALLLALAIGASISGGIFILMSRRRPKPEVYVVHTLTIATSDGHKTSFSSENGTIVENAFRLLTERLNGGGGREPVTVNFAPETAAAAPTPRETRGAPSFGTGRSQQTAGGNGFLRTHPEHNERSDRGIPHAAGGDARAVKIEEGFHPARTGAANAFPLQPAARGGSGQPSPAPPADSFIDFSGVLPAIVEMHRFYARQPGALHLEQRLSELELLMRAGTPTSSQKARLKELAVDMSQILQAYPQAVQLFDHVGALAA